MKKSLADSIIEQTAKDYNRIADHFSVTRAHAWPEFAFVTPYLRKGSRVLDVGCGNGRLISFLEQSGAEGMSYTGVDVSEKLLGHAKNLHKDSTLAPRFQVASHTSLPCADGAFDIVFSIASLYHVPSDAYRAQAVQECFRVLKPGGVLFLITWNFWQPAFWPLLLSHALSKLKGQSALDWRDFYRPWKDPKGNTVVNRYCHAFTKRELIRLATRAGFTIEMCESVFRDTKAPLWKARNLVLIARK